MKTRNSLGKARRQLKAAVRRHWKPHRSSTKLHRVSGGLGEAKGSLAGHQ